MQLTVVEVTGRRVVVWCVRVCTAAAVFSWLYRGVVAVSIHVCVLMDEYGNGSQQLSSCCYGVTVFVAV